MGASINYQGFKDIREIQDSFHFKTEGYLRIEISRPLRMCH